MGVIEDNRLEKVMLGDKEINRKIIIKFKCKVIRILIRAEEIRVKKNKYIGNKLGL